MKSKISVAIVGVYLSVYVFGQSPDLVTKKDTVVSDGMVTDANALSGKMRAPAAVRQQQAAVRNGATTRSGRETDLGEGMYLWDSATDPASALLEVTVDNDSWNNLIARGTFYNGLQSVSALLYTKFNDDFDFIFFVLNTSNEGTILTDLGFYGINMNAGNDVQGLGLGVYNDASSWGSAGKLKSVMYFPYYNAILNGPTLHELCHNWAAFICPTYSPDNSRYDGHWGISNAGGQLGGFKHVRKVEENSDGVAGKTLYQASFSSAETNADGSFKYGGFGVNANGGNGLPYSDIELYLMGMKSAQELRNAGFRLDIYSGNGYNYEGARSFGDGYFYSTTVTSYSIDDIIAANGERTPPLRKSSSGYSPWRSHRRLPPKTTAQRLYKTCSGWQGRRMIRRIPVGCTTSGKRPMIPVRWL